MKFKSISLAIALAISLSISACGGGDTTNNYYTTTPPVVTPPVVTPPVVTPPVVTPPVVTPPVVTPPVVTPPVVTPPPYGAPYNQSGLSNIPKGNLSWNVGGMGYMVIFRDADVAQFSLLISTSNPSSVTPEWVPEIIIDDSFDLHPPSATDEAIKVYIDTYLLPQLNGWLMNNPNANSVTMEPVLNADVPMAWTALRRVAALVPQWVKIESVNGKLVAVRK